MNRRLRDCWQEMQESAPAFVRLRRGIPSDIEDARRVLLEHATRPMAIVSFFCAADHRAADVSLGRYKVETGMRSTVATHASGTARRASQSQAARVLARAGLTARGVLYILIGWVAILVALGQTSRQADQQGALQLLAGKPYGLVSLWLLAIGFAGYALCA